MHSLGEGNATTGKTENRYSRKYDVFTSVSTQVGMKSYLKGESFYQLRESTAPPKSNEPSFISPLEPPYKSSSKMGGREAIGRLFAKVKLCL